MTSIADATTSWGHDDAVRRRTKRWSVHGPGVLDMTVAEMDFSVAEPIAAAIADAVRRQTFGYPIPAEHSQLPSIAAAWARSALQLPISADQVRLLPELMRGITNTLLMSGPAAPVIILTPSYRSFFGAVAAAGRPVVEVPMAVVDDRYELDLQALDEAIGRTSARTVILCNPANPVGRVFTLDELRALADVVELHDAMVISDEIHAPLRYGVPHVSYAAIDERTSAHTVTLFGPSKAWNIPGLRTGFLATSNDDQLRHWDALPSPMKGGISPLGMVGAGAAFEHGERWLQETLHQLEVTRDRIGELFREAGHADRYRAPEATYLAWFDLRGIGLPDPAGYLLDQAQVAVTPGTDHGAAGEGFVRMNFASETAIVEEAVRRILREMER